MMTTRDQRASHEILPTLYVASALPRRCADSAANWVKANGRCNYPGLDTPAEGKP